jgi:hypothetical protein
MTVAVVVLLRLLRWHASRTTARAKRTTRHKSQVPPFGAA